MTRLSIGTLADSEQLTMSLVMCFCHTTTSPSAGHPPHLSGREAHLATARVRYLPADRGVRLLSENTVSSVTES